ncbi:biotin transporter BioY [bacterium 1XD42-94]|nr:biotin transporter BioY [bacterium 1XD42-76]NBK04561.1 biotin transporter BioY [bacterium 1XD42-94]
MEHVTVSKKLTITQMTAAALMTAITCILGPMSLPIPISPVPISLTNLVIYMMAYVLGARLSLVSYATYLLLGAVGLPVFSGFSGGLAKLAGPTGGYLVGFLFLAPIAGFFVEKFPERISMHILGMVLGTTVCYLFGTVWLASQLKMDFVSGLFAGVIPYLPGDAAKIIAAVLIGPRLSRAVSQLPGH